MEWKHVILGVVFMAMLAAVIRPSTFDTPAPVPAPTPAPAKVVVKTKVVEKAVPTNKKPDGYVSRDECFGIPEDMPVDEVMYRFGWPAGSNGRAVGLGDADYPIREDHGATCTVFFPYGTVSAVRYHRDASDYGGTDTWDASS